MDEKILEVKNAEYTYSDGFKALNGISFYINKGEKVGLVGSNGAGKSTLLKNLVGLLTLTKGEILINNVKLEKKTLKYIRENIGFIFQESDNQLFMNKVYDDISFGLKSRKENENTIKEKVEDIMKKMGITNLKDKQVYKLSGGEKKMASIAGILVMEPNLILMDEPTVSLDPKSRRRIINFINTLKESCLITSHDLDMILDCCNRVIVLRGGNIIADGNPFDILSNKELMENTDLEVPLSLKNRI